MRHIFRWTAAVLTAAVCLTAPFDAFGFRAKEYRELPNGGVQLLITEGTYHGFLIVTDGTVSEAEMKEFKGVSNIVPAQGERVTEYTPQLSEAIARWGDGTEAYIVCIKPAYVEILREYARMFSMEFDGILDAAWLDFKEIGYGRWNGYFFVSYNRTDTVTTAQLEKEAEITQRAIDFCTDWQADVTAWEATVDADSMTDEAYKAARQAAGIPSDYEILQSADAFAVEIEAAYGEGVVEVEPMFQTDSDVLLFDGTSVWDGIGDCNGDGAVNAADAAAVLEQAAASGAGDEGILDAAQQDAGNVNRDEVLNAADAGCILYYAAESGSGNLPSWGRIV